MAENGLATTNLNDFESGGDKNVKRDDGEPGADTSYGPRRAADAVAVPSGVVFSPDGTRAYIGFPDSGKIAVVDTTTNKVIGTLDGDADV